jgi:acyl carrier protein
MDRVDWAYVKSFIAKKLAIDSEKITPDSFFVNDLGATSLQLVELMTELKKGLKIEMPDEEVKELVTARKLLEYLVIRVK